MGFVLYISLVAGDGLEGGGAQGSAIISAVIFFGALSVSELSRGAVARLDLRHERVMEQLFTLAAERDGVYSAHPVGARGDWPAAPFSRVRGLKLGPQVDLRHARHPAKAGWLEGDYGPAVLPLRTFTSRVAWVELPREVPPVDFVPEGFKQAFAKLVGGTDIDVESYDFNRRWRVKAQSEPDAHAMLQPLLIQFLNDVEDGHLAFQVDCLPAHLRS